MWVASSTSESYLFFYLFIFVYYLFDVFYSDDKVEGLALSSAFDITCMAWKVKMIFRFEIFETH